MVFACQLDSFQKTFTTKVVSCEPGKLKTQKDGKNITEDCFEVVCEDTILFPEGGGQPYDKGFMNDVPVEQVLRRGSEAVHYVKTKIEIGHEVKQVVDWERRLDHMQQHSGQHLITAVASAEYKYETTSWWLGEKVSHIELDTTKMTVEEMMNIEKIVNNKIMEQVPVIVTIHNEETIQDIRTRGLPKDHTGPVRVVEIVGLENNMCCGTHVTNLIQLQCVKLLYFEKGKKNKTNLFFIVGGRVLKHLTNCLSREQKLTSLLKNEPDKHGELVERLQTTLKSTNKKLSRVLKDIATYEANKFKDLVIKPKYYFYFNGDGDVEYLDCYLRCLKEDENIEDTLLILTVGEEKGNGNLVVHGKPDIVKALGPQIAETLEGKGAQHGSKFQGKVRNLGNLKSVQEIVSKYFENQPADTVINHH